MELHTIKEKDMKLLSRKRVTLDVESSGATPPRVELIRAIAHKFNIKEDLVVIRHIYPQFGKTNAKVIVHLYDDPKKKEMFELGNRLKVKNNGKTEKE
jgi:ribosomal protein S24E